MSKRRRDTCGGGKQKKRHASDVEFADEYKTKALIRHLLKDVYARDTRNESDVVDAFHTSELVCHVGAPLLKKIRPGEVWNMYVLDFDSEGFEFSDMNGVADGEFGGGTVRLRDVTTVDKLMARCLKTVRVSRDASSEIEYLAGDQKLFAKKHELVHITISDEYEHELFHDDLVMCCIKYEDIPPSLGVFRYNAAYTFLNYEFVMPV